MIQTQLGEVFRTVVYNDYPEKWPGLLPELYTSLTSQVGEGVRVRPGAPDSCTWHAPPAPHCLGPDPLPRSMC